MKVGNIYYRTEDLLPYRCLDVVVKEVPYLTISPKYFRLKNTKGKVVYVYKDINMHTTRDWSNSKQIAIGNKIKLLENEIVSLTILRKGLKDD